MFFLIAASDGLWDWLEADTAVRLVRDHSFGAMTLQPYEPVAGQNLSSVFASLRERRAGERKSPLDSNVATHLLRHALGGVSGGVQGWYRLAIDLVK